MLPMSKMGKDNQQMNYTIHNIKKGQCRHEIWGITCDRNREIMNHLNNVAHLLSRVDTKNPLELLLKECLNVAENDQEAMYVAFAVGEQLGASLTEHAPEILKEILDEPVKRI